MKDKIGIVIVNYNGIKFNEECIDSIFDSTYNDFEIVVVDNKSSDDSVNQLKKKYQDKITIVCLDNNYGFSKANNIGIKIALDEKKCKYILLLNNDTVIDKKMIENMLIKAKQYNDMAIIAPKIYYYDNPKCIWSAGGEIVWNKGKTIQYGMDCKDNSKYNEEKEITFATGCCMFISNVIIETIGDLSDEYFLYYEDTDFCVKAIKNNFKIIYAPSCCMYHKVSASTGGEKSPLFVYYMNRNRLIFNSKYNNKKFNYSIYIFTSILKNSLVYVFKGRINLLKSIFRAIKDYKKNIYGKVEL